MICANSRVAANPELLSTELDGETVMMDVESGQYYTLNGIGSRIWRDLSDPIDVATLCGNLEEEYDASSDVIRQDVLRFLSHMLEKRLIRIET